MVDDKLQQQRMPVAATQGAGIVISSRVRVARNLAGAAFPGWSGKRECTRLYDRLRRVISEAAGLTRPATIAMEGLSPIDREVLREKHLISYELAAKGAGSGLVLSEPERAAIMINEEDHLRIQVVHPELNLAAAWNAVLRIHQALERHLSFAFSKRFGYLTSCPSNVGTGLRAGVMIHLPGLRLMGEIDPVMKGLHRMGLAVRGAFGEGTDASGALYQISNQTTLGVNETDVIERLTGIIAYLVRQERQARARLDEQRRLHLEDHCARAYAILMHARILSSGEAMDILSGLRMGIEFGIVVGVKVHHLDEIIRAVQPGHLQQTAGRALDNEDRDRMRAQRVREALAAIRLEGFQT